MGKGKSGNVNILPQKSGTLKIPLPQIYDLLPFRRFFEHSLTAVVLLPGTYLPPLPLDDYSFSIPYSNGN